MRKLVLSSGQADLLFTMLCAQASETDPFVMEERLKEKGIVKQPSTL